VSKIWLDVTTILSWQRPAVGIIRVEAECAKFALEHLASEFDFCRYDPDKGYLQVTTSAVRETIDRISRGHRTDAPIGSALADSTSPPTVRPPAERRLAVLIQRLARSALFNI
jgi:hypothetical protein